MGDPVVSTIIPGRRYRVTNSRSDVAARSDAGSETCVIPWYRQTKENEVRREG
jgi:hypothetical protein